MPNSRSYLDYNASAPLLDEARAAMIAALDLVGNPSSVHSEGRAARAVIENARRNVAALVGAKAGDVVFTSGATEGASTLLTPHYRAGRTPLRASHLYVGATEHPCVLAGGSFDRQAVTIIPVEPSGVLDREALRESLAAHDNATGIPLVAVQMANNETGVVQPIAEIAAIVRDVDGLLIVDAVQAAGRIPIDLSDGSFDFLILSSHKIGGPKGAGAIVASSGQIMPEPKRSSRSQVSEPPRASPGPRSRMSLGWPICVMRPRRSCAPSCPTQSSMARRPCAFPTRSFSRFPD